MNGKLKNVTFSLPENLIFPDIAITKWEKFMAYTYCWQKQILIN